MLTFTQTELGGHAQVAGPMTIHNAMELKCQFMEALSVSQHLQLDLATVTEIDAAGLQLLIMAKQHQIHISMNLP
jgi:anti-sigma B factor antagonist